ncbi:hypothetical protein JCM19239_2416 [Vibrio variabilis]|uniref:Uncharacterized protein n=1 Tax=Vibrio variabilis TaxID=990271 RepID=A0ABQ0JK19_9VIBR|nr:hypothetical protein JCM19239_2416 [Vibrio variabilis]
MGVSEGYAQPSSINNGVVTANVRANNGQHYSMSVPSSDNMAESKI